MDERLKRKMDELREINWSEVARKAIQEKIAESELWQPADATVMKKASDDIDSLRRSIKEWDSTAEIRRWRDRDRRR